MAGLYGRAVTRDATSSRAAIGGRGHQSSKTNDGSQPVEVVQRCTVAVRSWPTDDAPHPLTACPEPDAQGAGPKVSFVVLRSQAARHGFGQQQSLEAFLQATASGCMSSLSPMADLMGQRDKPEVPISGPSC